MENQDYQQFCHRGLRMSQDYRLKIMEVSQKIQRIYRFQLNNFQTNNDGVIKCLGHELWNWRDCAGPSRFCCYNQAVIQ